MTIIKYTLIILQIIENRIYFFFKFEKFNVTLKRKHCNPINKIYKIYNLYNGKIESS